MKRGICTRVMCTDTSFHFIYLEENVSFQSISKKLQTEDFTEDL